MTGAAHGVGAWVPPPLGGLVLLCCIMILGKKTVSMVGACICWMIALAFWKGRQSGGPSQQLIEVGRLHGAKSGIDDKRKPFVQGYMWIEQ